MKRCCTCKATKSVDEFGNNASSKDGLQKRCLDCARASSAQYYQGNKDKARAAVKSWAERNPERLKESSAAWRSANPDKVKGYRRKANLKGSYGLTEEQFAEMAAHGCSLCGIPDAPGKRLHVDHDHTCCSGAKSCGSCVRGLLCTNCNHGLGHFKDDPKLLRKAIMYLSANASTRVDTSC